MQIIQQIDLVGGEVVAYEKLEYPNQKSEKQTPPIDFQIVFLLVSSSSNLYITHKF